MFLIHYSPRLSDLLWGHLLATSPSLGPVHKRDECQLVGLGKTGLGRHRAPEATERLIHDLCAVVADFNFVNRMAIGLGVELEDRFG